MCPEKTRSRPTIRDMHVRLEGISPALACLASFPASPASPPVYQLTTVAGSDLVGDGELPYRPNWPSPGLIIDPAGNLTSPTRQPPRPKVSPTGTISTVAGNGHPVSAATTDPRPPRN